MRIWKQLKLQKNLCFERLIVKSRLTGPQLSFNFTVRKKERGKRDMLGVVKRCYSLYSFKRKWRLRNSHNSTNAVHAFFIDNVQVGNYTYGGIDVLTYNRENKLTIGHFCSIAPGVKFILSADHYTDHVSTFPFKAKIIGSELLEGISKGNIVVEDDVWLGMNSIILSGVHIGQGAIVAAGAVVSSNVEPYAIIGGIPAKEIKKRFSDDKILELMALDFSKLTPDIIRKNIDQLYAPYASNDAYDFFPRKNHTDKV